MKKYKVIEFFTDLRDYDHAYNVGDEFPRPGVTVGEDRLAELSSCRNKQRRPLIQAVDDGETPDPPAQNVNPEQPGTAESNDETKTQEQTATPEQSVTPEQNEIPEQTATSNISEGSKKYSKEEIEALKLPQIRELAGQLGFKISSTSKDGAVVEFMEKQG